MANARGPFRPHGLQRYVEVQTSFVRAEGDHLRRTPFTKSRAEILPLEDWPLQKRQPLLILRLLDWQVGIPLFGLRGVKLQVRKVEDVVEPYFVDNCFYIQALNEDAADAMVRVSAHAIILAFPSAGVLERWCNCFCAAGGTMHDLDEGRKEVTFSSALASGIRKLFQSALRRS
jgi:hypothetical protein